MKISKLLVLSALWLVGLCASAADLIERVEPVEPEVQPIFGDLGISVSDIDKTPVAFEVGKYYVLYNVGAGKYFSQGCNWATQASLHETPLAVRFTLPEGKTLEDACLLLNDFNLYTNSWKLAFFDNETQMYTDRGSQANIYWQVVSQGNNVYRLQASEENPTFKPSVYPGFVGRDEAVTDRGDNHGRGVGEDADPLSPFLEEGEGHHIDWQFFSVPQLEEWNKYFDDLAIYNQSVKLKEQIEKAEVFGVDVSAAVSVYNNLNSTIEQMQQAIINLQVAMANSLSGATETNPLDATFLIQNNDFSAGNADGWDITYKGGTTEATNIGYQGASYSNGDVTISGFIEAWKDSNTPNYLGDGSITQTIPSLPAGKYMLGVDVIANNQGRKSVDSNPNGLPDDVELFAQASADGKTYKTNMATRNGAPEHFEFTFVHTGGDMTMGLRVIGSAEAQMPANWIAMDNLTLTYYGEVKEDPDKVLMDLAIAEALKVYPLESLGDVVAYVGDKEAFKAIVEEAWAATEGYQELLEKVNAAKKQLDASVAAYANFSTKYEGWKARMVDFDFENDLWFAYCDFIDGMSEEGSPYPEETPEEVLTKQDLTIEQINAYIDLVDDLFRKAFSASLTDGSDVTLLLKNADLVNGSAGWTTSASGGNFLPGGYELYHCFEAWHATNFNFSQTIEDLPIGVYELSTQGYVRYLDGQSAIDQAENRPANIPIYIFMNDSKANLPNWIEYGQEPGFFNDFNEQLSANGWWSSQSSATFLTDANGLEYPDNMTAAAAAFAKGDYTVRTYGLVANEGESFTLGLKGDVSEAQYWPLWGQFKLTYRGFNPEVIAEALDAALPMIDTSKPMAKSLFTRATELQEAAATAKAADDGEKMFAVLKDIYALTEDINNSVILFSKLQTAVDDLIAVANEFDSPAKAEALALATEIQSGIDELKLENADAEAYLVKISAMKTKLRLPANVNEANDDAPVNVTAVIETPGFEKDGTNSIYGWTATGQKFGNDDQLSALALESWESVFHIYQDIIGLPEGTYTLKVNGWQRTASPTYLYAESEGQTFEKELIKLADGMPAGLSEPSTLIGARDMFDEVTFMNTLVVKAAGDKLRIGVRKDETTSADWIVIDEFQLWYHGANSQLNPDSDGIEDVANSQTVKVEYFTLDGRKANSLQKGIMIQKITFDNGAVIVKKIRK